MTSITIGTDVYRAAEQYARHHNISIDRVVELGLNSLFKSEKEKHGYNVVREEDFSPIVKKLLGIAKSDADNDINGKEIKESFLRDRYRYYESLS